MKKLIILLAFVLITPVLHSQTKQKTDTLKMVSWLKFDRDSVKVFYGLSPTRIITMPIDEIKEFVQNRKITTSEFFTALLKARNYLKEEKIKRDSIELIQIYDRIERKLGIKKANGNNP